MKLHNVLIRPTDLFEEILRRKLISGENPVYEATSTTGMFFTDMAAPSEKAACEP